MKLNKPVLIQCRKCGEVIEVYDDFECVSCEERNMGEEYEHEITIDDSCPNCDNSLFLRIDAWEYPVGALNYLDYEIEGADIIDEIDISFFD